MLRFRGAVVALAIVGCVACNSSKKVSVDNSNREIEQAIRASILPSGEDSLSYVIGMNVAEQLYKMDTAINISVVCRAILEQSEGSALLTREQAREYYLRYLLYAEPERRRGYEERMLSDLAMNDRAFTRTKSGLTYHIEVIGDESLTPRGTNDWVTLKCTISRVGGEVLMADSIYSDGVSTLLDGVSESVKMIGKGGKIKSWIPSKLAYGETGEEELGVEPIETLLFDIEIVDVEKGTATTRRKELEVF